MQNNDHYSIILLMTRVMKLQVLTLCLIVLVAGQPNNFDYNDHGDTWGQAYPACDPTNEDMNQQSPISITDEFTRSNQSFLFSNFYPADAALSFLNTTVYLKSAGFGEIYSRTINGDIVVMKATELRFRAHAEHQIYNQFYDLEMQIFFIEAISSARNERLAMSLHFQVAADGQSKVLKAIKDAHPDKAKVNIDLSEHLSNADPFDFWYYLGSPTIPPCKNSGLQWIVSKKVLKMGQEQRDFFWNLFNNENMEGNYRKVQPLRGNIIDSFHFSSA